jgi:hypothetical protein
MLPEEAVVSTKTIREAAWLRRARAAAWVLVLVGCAPHPQPGADPRDRMGGTWVSPAGELRIWAVGDAALRVEFEGEHEYVSAAGPMTSVGTGEGIAVLAGGRAVFRPEGAEAECAITLRFAGERLEVTQTGACGFGLNVTAAGRYRRVARTEPKFGVP